MAQSGSNGGIGNVTGRGCDMTQVRLSNAHKAIVGELYEKASRTVDDLPYTDEFDKLYAEFVARSGRQLTRHDFWRALSNARKASRLVRKKR
jgi:hypothetical protein